MLRRLKGRRELRALCAWSFRTSGSEKGLRGGLIRKRKMRGGKEVTVHREGHFEGRKVVKVENQKRSELSQKRDFSGKRQFGRVTRFLRLV